MASSSSMASGAASAATSVASSQTQTQTHKGLKAKFQIGSIHGRMNYQNSERVFHPSDMPKKARSARKEVLANIGGPQAAKKRFQVITRNGCISGKLVAPWDDDSERRIYNKLMLQHNGPEIQKERAKKAREKLESLKLAGNWNQSTLCSKGYGGTFTKARKNDPDHPGFTNTAKGKTQKILSMKLHKRPTLVERETERMKTQRIEALAKREDDLWREKCAREQAEIIHDKPRPNFDHEAIKKNLEKSYPIDHLSKFLESETKRNAEEQKKNEYEKTLKLSKIPKATYRTANLAYSTTQDRPFVSKAGASTSKSGGLRTKRRTMKDPTMITTRYEHLGAFKYCQFEDCDAWSCCMSTDKDSRGCTIVEVRDVSRWQYE